MVQFEKAGRMQGNDRVFLQSRNRRYRHNATIFHRNDHHTTLRFPDVFFNKHFTFNRSTGIYENSLRYSDCVEFMETQSL